MKSSLQKSRLISDSYGHDQGRESYHNTVWKFQNFSGIQILREINYGTFTRSLKTAIF